MLIKDVFILSFVMIRSNIYGIWHKLLIVDSKFQFFLLEYVAFYTNSLFFKR